MVSNINLHPYNPGVFAGSGPQSASQQSLWQRAANSLFVEYLAEQGYSYAQSVFQPECGLTDQQVLSRDELTRVLAISPSSAIARFLPSERDRANEQLLLGVENDPSQQPSTKASLLVDILQVWGGGASLTLA